MDGWMSASKRTHKLALSHLVLVLLRLAVEDIHAGHRHDANTVAELCGSSHCVLHLRARRHDDELEVALLLLKDVTALRVPSRRTCPDIAGIDIAQCTSIPPSPFYRIASNKSRLTAEKEAYSIEHKCNNKEDIAPRSHSLYRTSLHTSR